MDIAAYKFFLRCEIVLEQPPINRCGRILIYAVIVHITSHANDFVPGIVRAEVYQFSNSSGRRAPVLASKIFRDNNDWTFFKLFLPSHVASRDQRDSHGLKEIWGHKLLQA